MTPQNTFKLRRCCNVISTTLQSRLAITNESSCTQPESKPERCATGVSFTECALPDSDLKCISPGTCCVATETCCAEPEKPTQSSAHGFNKVTVETLNDRVGSGNIRVVTKEQIDIIATGTNRAVSEKRLGSIPKTDKIKRVVTEEQNSRYETGLITLISIRQLSKLRHLNIRICCFTYVDCTMFWRRSTQCATLGQSTQPTMCRLWNDMSHPESTVSNHYKKKSI